MKQNSQDDDTAEAYGIDVFFDLVKGYYQATRKAGHSVLFSFFNGIRLAIKAY